MFLIYSLLLTLAFVLMSPLFLLRREKYAAGFRQRLGNYPEFKHDGRKVIWLHCVSVGETNAARPLVDEIKSNFPDHRLIVSTTTKTGQELAQNIFKDKADAVFYFPFDWKFTVRRALHHFQPEIVLLMETEIWPRFLQEAKISGVRAVIVNGRISPKSFDRYSYVKSLIRRTLLDIDLALMQTESDAKRITLLGIESSRVKTTGNLKFDLSSDESDSWLTYELGERFGISYDNLLIIAASTHAPEESWVLEAFARAINKFPEVRLRLMIVPRHPERFYEVAQLVSSFNRKANSSPLISFARRSEAVRQSDKTVKVILLDSIGELRAVYPLAGIVFVGGSMVARGGQSILEPASMGRAIITGPYTHNFEHAVRTFLADKAIIQLVDPQGMFSFTALLFEQFDFLIRNDQVRNQLGQNALAVMTANSGATKNTIENLKLLI